MGKQSSKSELADWLSDWWEEADISHAEAVKMKNIVTELRRGKAKQATK